MSDYFCIRIGKGPYQCGITTDGRDFIPIPTAAYAMPGPAIDYCEMRQANLSPLRSGQEGASHQAFTPGPDLSRADWAPGEVMEAYGK